MTTNQMPFKTGDRVIYNSDGGPDAGLRGTVETIIGVKFIVRWDDGEKIDYRHHVGSCIRKLDEREQRRARR